MDKERYLKDKLETFITNIIIENPLIHKIIKDLSDIKTKLLIQISNDNLSWAKKEDNQIILGIGCIQNIYNICTEFCNDNNIKLCIDNLNCKKSDKINVGFDYDDIADYSIIKNLYFLYGEKSKSKPALALTLYSLAFTLYHEFGHIKNDKDAISTKEKAMLV